MSERADQMDAAILEALAQLGTAPARTIASRVARNVQTLQAYRKYGYMRGRDMDYLDRRLRVLERAGDVERAHGRNPIYWRRAGAS